MPGGELQPTVSQFTVLRLEISAVHSRVKSEPDMVLWDEQVMGEVQTLTLLHVLDFLLSHVNVETTACSGLKELSFYMRHASSDQWSSMPRQEELTTVLEAHHHLAVRQQQLTLFSKRVGTICKVKDKIST